MVTMEPRDVRFFESAADLRNWFDANHATAAELWVGYHRKGTGRSTLDWSAAVDEALCVGWIDGIRKGLDDQRHVQRFTPRRRGSIWSVRNVAKVTALTAEGRMRPAGLAAFEARSIERTAVYAYERPIDDFTADELARFRADRAAWTDWQSRPASYRRQVTHWVTSAKQAATRERRLATLIEDSAAGRKIRHLRWSRDER